MYSFLYCIKHAPHSSNYYLFYNFRFPAIYSVTCCTYSIPALLSVSSSIHHIILLTIEKKVLDLCILNISSSSHTLITYLLLLLLSLFFQIIMHEWGRIAFWQPLPESAVIMHSWMIYFSSSSSTYWKVLFGQMYDVMVSRIMGGCKWNIWVLFSSGNLLLPYLPPFVALLQALHIHLNWSRISPITTNLFLLLSSSFNHLTRSIKQALYLPSPTQLKVIFTLVSYKVISLGLIPEDFFSLKG